MSKIDVGPLAAYNSLTDRHLAGYFNNTKMRRHLVKSGLITRQGEVVPESVYRINVTRKDHRRNVRDLLAQAIVHKTLDMERSRQVSIRRKLEEISKIELVRRVRSDRHRKGDEDLIPLMSPRVRRPKKSPNRLRDSLENGSVSDTSDQGACVDPIFVDADGMPVSPDAESRARLLKKFPNEEIDSKHLYALDSVALREYAKVLERYEKGRVAKSPYLMSQMPRPPTAGPSGSRRPATSGGASSRPTKSAGSKKQGALVMHRPEPALMHQSRWQSLCEVEMRYFGQQVFTGREDVDPAQEVVVEQQHCGGNTLIVFKRRILPGTVFSFYSRRHRGYPFSLTFFINGVKDSRLSACCEYRHSKGARLGGKQGHFGVVRVTGAAPCYKCQVERGAIPADSGTKPRRSSKSVAKKAPAADASEEYKDDFEDDKEAEPEVEAQPEVEVEKEDETKSEDDAEAARQSDAKSSSSSSKSSSKASSAASSPRLADDVEVSDQPPASGRRVEGEEAIEGRPLSFGDSDDEVQKTGRTSGASTPDSGKKSSDSGSSSSSSSNKVAVESDSDGGKSGASLSKGSSLVKHESIEVPVEEDEEQLKDSDKAAKEKEKEQSDEEEQRQREPDVAEKAEEEKVEKAEEVKEDEAMPEPPKETKTVTFSVFTGDDLGAGTSSRIHCRIIGSEGTSDIIDLGGSDDKDRRFERGSVDSFRLPVSGLGGRPQQLEIWHDGSGLGATWLLDKVLVLADGEEFEFVFRNWIEGDTGAGDHHQFIDVTPAGDGAPAATDAAPLVLDEDEKDRASSSSSSSSSSSEDEGEDDTKAPPKGIPHSAESSSPSSSSDEEADEKAEEKSGRSGAASESGPDGGYDPDDARDADTRPVLADSLDEAEAFSADGDVAEFVKPVSPGGEANDGAYSVEVINTALDTAQLSRLAKVMDERPIECLNIRNGRIDDEKLRILLDVLESKEELKLLNLNCNNIGPQGAAMIADRMSRWTKLELLLLHGNPLLDDGIDAIVTAIISRNQRLKGTGTTLGALRSLDLGDSEMTNQGAYVVCQLLAENVNLESLELTGNRKIGLDGWRQIGEALGTNKCLRTLSADYCGLRDDQLSCLVARLHNNTSLISLDLEGNEVSDEGGRRLRQVLVENGTLCDVSLRPGNVEMSDDLVEEVVEMASKNAED